MLKEDNLFLLQLIVLALFTAIVVIVFGKQDGLRSSIKNFLGNFFVGTIVGFIVYDTNWSVWVKKVVVLAIGLFAKELYNEISKRIGGWLTKYVNNKINNKKDD